jgi:hypothetical protein
MPFNRFHTIEGATVDSLLGPEMRLTGEVMGLSSNFGLAFAKSQAAPTDSYRNPARSSSRWPTATNAM